MKKCVVCNADLKIRPREGLSRFNKRKLCSLKCRQKYIVKKKLERFVPAKCVKCGIEIHCTDKTGRRSSRRKFCSKKCNREWNRGSNHYSWKGGIKKHGEYLQIFVGKDHPFSDFHGYIFEHRFVFENYAKKHGLNSYLVKDTETGFIALSPVVKIHHKNHNKSDNRIENLHPMNSQLEHFHYNYCPHCPHCNKSGELLETPNGTISSQI